MEYKVVLTSAAKIQFRNILNYLLYEFKSQQAATNVVIPLSEAPISHGLYDRPEYSIH